MSCTIRRFVVLFSLLLSTALVYPQSSFNTLEAGRTVPEIGYSDDVVIDHGRIYVGGDNGIAIIDSATNRVLSYIGGSGWGYQSVAVVHPMLYYVGLQYTGSATYLVGAVDMSDAGRPVLLGTYNLNDVPMAITASGTKAYVCGQNSGVRIIDFSDPNSPGEPGFYDSPGQPLVVQIVDSLAYVADGTGGVRIVNIKNALMPIEVGAVATDMNVSYLRVSGSRLFTRESSMWGTMLKIYSLADRLQPVQIDSIAAAGVSFEIRDSLLVMSASSLEIWAVPLSGSPYLLGSASLGIHSWGSTAVSGNLIVCGREALQSFDIADPANPTRTHYWYPPYRSSDVVQVGSHQISCDGRTVRILDCTDPERPIETGFWGTHTGNAIRATGSDTLVYVAGGLNGLHILSIADPRHPVELSTFDTPDQAHGIHVQGPYAYVADGASGLRIFDVSNPRQPIPVGFLNTPGMALDVSVRGNVACVADGDSGLAIIDVTNPYSPQLRSYLHTTRTVWDVVQVDSFAYVAEYQFFYSGPNLRVLNIADPANPSTEVEFQTLTHCWNLHVAGDYLYVATVDQGFDVLDISTRTGPTLVARYVAAQGSGGYAVTTDGPYVYVSSSADGVRVVQNLLVSAPPVPTAPYLGESGVPLDVALRWKPMAGATEYHVQLSLSSAFTALLDEDSTLTAVQHGVSGLAGSARHFWRVRARLTTGWSPWSTVMQFTTEQVTAVHTQDAVPVDFVLEQNYPNPFNPSTTIRFAIPERLHVSLEVFNILGQHVATLVDEERQAGNHAVDFRATSMASGIYLYRLQAGDFVQTRKLILLR